MCVVVDVHVRVAQESGGEEVDELLERALFLVAARRPEGAELAVGENAVQVFKAACRLVERIALDVVEDVAG